MFDILLITMSTASSLRYPVLQPAHASSILQFRVSATADYAKTDFAKHVDPKETATYTVIYTLPIVHCDKLQRS